MATRRKASPQTLSASSRLELTIAHGLRLVGDCLLAGIDVKTLASRARSRKGRAPFLSFATHAFSLEEHQHLFSGRQNRTKYKYDANGFQQSNGLRTVAYKPSGLPSTITSGATNATIQYGPSNERVYKKLDAQNSIVYVGGLYEQHLVGGQTTYVFKIAGEAGTIAEVNWVSQNGGISQTVKYLHQDNLGSIETVSLQDGTLLEHRKYEPFGERRNPANLSLSVAVSSGADDEGFTAQVLDGEVSLIDMHGRVYDPHDGQFLSPDIFGPAGRTPSQRHGLYRYVRNNPLRYVDPSGWEDPGGFGGGAEGGGGGGGQGGGGQSAADASAGNTPIVIGISMQVGTPPDLQALTGGPAPQAQPATGDSYGTANNFGAAAGVFATGLVNGLGGALPGLAVAGGLAVLATVSSPATLIIGLGLLGYSAINGYNQGGLGGALDAVLPVRPFWQASSEFTTAFARGEYQRSGNAFGHALLSGVAIAAVVAGASSAGATLGEAGQVARIAEVGSTAENALTGTAVRYGPMNPGPLPTPVANTFRSASYTEVTLTKSTTLYRAHGGNAGPLGNFWTGTKPAGPLQAQIDLALAPEWGNTATQVTRINVPAGTTIYEGAASAQGGLVGGGNQVFIPRVEPSWVTP